MLYTHLLLIFCTVSVNGSYYMYTELKQLKQKEEEENEGKFKKRSMDSLIKYLRTNDVVSRTSYAKVKFLPQFL